jgi:hypothetical protein
MRPRTRLAFGRPFRQRLRQRPMGVDRAVRASSQVCCKTDRGSPNPKRLLAGHNRGTRRLSCRAEPTHLPLRLFFSSGKLHQAAPDACRRDRGRRDLSRRDWQQDASGMRRTEFGIFPVFRGLSGRLQVRPPVAYATEQEALRAAEYFASILGGRSPTPASLIARLAPPRTASLSAALEFLPTPSKRRHGQRDNPGQAQSRANHETAKDHTITPIYALAHIDT